MKRAIRVLLCITLLAPTIVFAGEVSLSCTLPTQNEDGTALTDLAGVRFYEAPTTGGPYVLVQENSTAPIECGAVLTRPPGVYYYVATAYNSMGTESVYSNEASKTIVDPVVPSPPTELIVLPGQLTAYMLSQTADVIVAGPVGTVPEGTPCDASMRFNDKYVVPRAAVSWVGSARPLVVFATCGAG